MSEITEINESFVTEYDSFLEQLEKLFSKSSLQNEFEYCKTLKEESVEEKVARGISFYNSLEDQDLFEQFCSKKTTLFSSKNENTENVSNSLLGNDLPLKKLINKQTSKTKDIVWNYLHTFYTLFEFTEKSRKERIDSTKKNLIDNSYQKDMIESFVPRNENEVVTYEKLKNNKFSKEMLNMDLNKSTSEMINDILGSFEDSLKNEDGNPFSNILEITNTISDKYVDRIENGEIELDKLLDSMKDKLPGLDSLASALGFDEDAKASSDKKEKDKEITIIDENFSTDNVELGFEDEKNAKQSNLASSINMINKLTNDEKMGDLFSMLSSSGDKKEEIMNSLSDFIKNCEGEINENEPSNNEIEETDSKTVSSSKKEEELID